MANASNIEQDLLRLVRLQASDGRTPAFAPVSLSAQSDAAPSISTSNGNGQSSDAVGDLARELASLRQQLGTAEETARKQTELLEQNTRAVLESGGRAGSGASGLARDSVSTARNFGGLGVLGSPLVSLFSRLFGRSDFPAETPLAPVSPPPPVSEDLGISPAHIGLEPVTYRADGLPRTAPQSAPAPATNITIQVQAMDSRSFVDNSDQIARAVREAMLNSHALNDVLGEM